MVYHVVEPSDQLSGLALITLSPPKKGRRAHYDDEMNTGTLERASTASIMKTRAHFVCPRLLALIIQTNATP